ncbi:signal transduction histidine kinase [Longilinea arvoryzae]|uniref:histidine kinase n=1 Tax=Longilinea arvoryzae TaxID=360412 RepID=A0A0S7BI23_9CHLR|nr:ATP-binding protein [Longilinea arvoryzae]GAP14816.1 signal transduction histidine kinase [Longilinea arvoryzae]
MDSPFSPIEVMQKAFPGLGPNEAARIVQNGTLMTVSENTVLCHEGKYETTFYLILQGSALVTKVINETETRILKHLSAGDFFGEMAIIHNAPRAATVSTLTPTTVLALEKEAFSDILETSSSISLAMVREVSSRLRQNDEMAIEDLRLKASELASAYNQLAELEIARNEFLTILAHELRTPLMAANGYLQIAQSGMLKDDELKSAIDTISHHVQDITSLVNNLLFLQEMKLILPDFQNVDLAGIVSNACEAYRQTALKNGCEIKLTAPEEKLIVRASSKSLERAFSAILDNAVKFSPDGGLVQVEVDRDETNCRVRIIDHGVGIPAEALPHIYDRFFHTDQIGDKLFRGIGLGLSIAREVIQQHGGKIEVSSVEGAGSQFTIHLPILTENNVANVPDR